MILIHFFVTNYLTGPIKVHKTTLEDIDYHIEKQSCIVISVELCVKSTNRHTSIFSMFHLKWTGMHTTVKAGAGSRRFLSQPIHEPEKEGDMALLYRQS